MTTMTTMTTVTAMTTVTTLTTMTRGIPNRPPKGNGALREQGDGGPVSGDGAQHQRLHIVVSLIVKEGASVTSTATQIAWQSKNSVTIERKHTMVFCAQCTMHNTQ